MRILFLYIFFRFIHRSITNISLPSFGKKVSVNDTLFHRMKQQLPLKQKRVRTANVLGDNNLSECISTTDALRE